MRSIYLLLIGIFFVIVLFKSEVASWFRIYEMFQFKSFHMYSIIGSAVVLGIIAIQFIKKLKLKSFYGATITIDPKEKSYSRYLLGGMLLGLGWDLAGACQGPMFTLLGAGFFSILIVIFSAMLGTYLYGRVKDYLPH